MMPNDFVKGCKNHFVSVRLKNGDFYTGILENTDHILNFVLTSVSMQKYGSTEEVKLDRAMIRGGSIQFISLSPNVTELVKTKRADVNFPTNNDNRRNNYGNNRGGGNQKQRRPNDNINNNNNYSNRGRGNGRGGQGNRGRGGYNRNNNYYNNNNNNNSNNGFVYTPDSK